MYRVVACLYHTPAVSATEQAPCCPAVPTLAWKLPSALRRLAKAKKKKKCGLTADVVELLVDGPLADVWSLAGDLDHVRCLLLVKLRHLLALCDLHVCVSSFGERQRTKKTKTKKEWKGSKKVGWVDAETTNEQGHKTKTLTRRHAWISS